MEIQTITTEEVEVTLPMYMKCRSGNSAHYMRIYKGANEFYPVRADVIKIMDDDKYPWTMNFDMECSTIPFGAEITEEEFCDMAGRFADRMERMLVDMENERVRNTPEPGPGPGPGFMRPATPGPDTPSEE